MTRKAKAQDYLGSKYSHRGGVVCHAPVERKALRDIAARARK